MQPHFPFQRFTMLMEVFVGICVLNFHVEVEKNIKMSYYTCGKLMAIEYEERDA